jgi:hypothetical protein
LSDRPTFNRWLSWAYAIACITNKTNEFLFSVESIWGVGIRGAIAKLPLPELSNRLLSVQPKKDRIFSTFSSNKSDRQPKPNECDCFLSIQPKIGTLLSHLIQGKSIASPNYFAIGFSNVN